MKYTGGKSCYNKATQEWKYEPRVYTDYYCSMKEWANLGKGKSNFMYQVRNKIAKEHPELYKDKLIGYETKLLKKHNYDISDEDGLLGFDPTKLEEYDFSKPIFKKPTITVNGLILRKLSFDRTGRRDSTSTEEYSATIIKEAIKLITHKDAEVDFYAWKGVVDHIEISFIGCNMPNIIILVDEYCGSTNQELIYCIDAIYDTLKAKLHNNYEKKWMKYFNNDYDIVYYKSQEDVLDEYTEWKGLWMWNDIIFPKSQRKYVGQHKVNISYK